MKYMVGLILITFANNILAGGTTGAFKVGELKIGENGVRIHASSGAWTDADQCSGANTTNRLYLLDTTPSFKEIFSGILAYKLADKPINFYVNGCVSINGTNYPNVKVVYL